MRIKLKSSPRRLVAFFLTLLAFALVVFSAYRSTSANKALVKSSIDMPPPDLGVGANLNGKRLFPANSHWNLDVSRAPVDPNSGNLIGSMGNSTGLHPDFGTVWAGAPNGIPYVVVAGDQSHVPIDFTRYGNQSDPGPYPVPANAPIEGGPSATGDRHVIVIDRDNWKLYEMFYSFPVSGGARWEADSGAVFDLNSNVLRTEGWTSADAAGLPIMAGLVRYDEAALQQEIRHALRFTAQNTRKAYIYPARHHASDITNPNVPAMGTRVRLKASVNISTYGPRMRVILAAMKRYGMLLADNGSNWYVNGSPDMRWDEDELHTIGAIKGSDFEVVRTPGRLVMTNSDFDGDARTDVSVYRPASGGWFIQASSNSAIRGQQFGISTDQPVPGDFDGDGLTDVAVFRDGAWYVSRSSDGSFHAEQFGVAGDLPVHSDYDGDGKVDVAVFRAGAWYLRQSSNGAIRSQLFGLSTDRPVTGDYDSDGKTDIAVYRPNTGAWYIVQSSNNVIRSQQFGTAGDLPVAADYDGDGKTDVAVYRPSTGAWYVLQSTTGGLLSQNFGIATDRPVTGDYDGDFKSDFAVFRPSSNSWYILSSYSGSVSAVQFGTSGDLPVPASQLP